VWRDGNAFEGRSRERGFTLVEVLVSLAILALALGLLLDMFATSSKRSRQAEQLAEAGFAAQSLLARVGNDLPLRSGRLSGGNGDSQQWEVRIDALPDTHRGGWPVTAYRITARISWMDGARERSVALTTLRLGPKGAPP
jgi:general secretion pathway protein I